jgi:hypothetical protein
MGGVSSASSGWRKSSADDTPPTAGDSGFTPVSIQRLYEYHSPGGAVHRAADLRQLGGGAMNGTSGACRQVQPA